MKLHLTNSDGNNLITGYDKGWVEINRQRYSHNLIVLPDQLILDWNVANLEALQAECFAQIATYKPDVVLLGTGERHQFIHPKLSVSLAEMGFSVECMNTAAACRTYNILMAEGRNVAAALLL